MLEDKAGLQDEAEAFHVFVPVIDYLWRQTAALKGDGYRGRPSPHSPSEMFQGVTILKALKVPLFPKVLLRLVFLFTAYLCK